MHDKRHTYEPDQPVTAWVMRSRATSWSTCCARASSREALHDPLEDDHPALLTETASAADEARRDLGVLLELLPDKQRLPIRYVKIEGLSVAQAAERTGLSESAVKVGVHRGLKALAAKLRSRT